MGYTSRDESDYAIDFFQANEVKPEAFPLTTCNHKEFFSTSHKVHAYRQYFVIT